jgi:hypothetical protein
MDTYETSGKFLSQAWHFSAFAALERHNISARK